MREQVVKEWFERGEHDIEVAKILFAEEKYPPGPVTSCTKKEVREMLEIAEEIINRLKEGVGE